MIFPKRKSSRSPAVVCGICILINGKWLNGFGKWIPAMVIRIRLSIRDKRTKIWDAF